MNTAITWGTNLVKTLLEKRITVDSVVVDATMGNGHDTLFLAQLVGSKGRVYSFDIQEAALNMTSERLQEASPDLENHVTLIHDSHEKVLSYVLEPIDAAMFNLGYLPGGDHQIVTREKTSINALKGVLQLLKKGGLVTLMIYYGHEGGIKEKDALLNFVSALPAKDYIVIKNEYINRSNNPPIIVMIEKK